MKDKLNVLMVVSWYTAKGEKVLKEGIFHNEQAVNMSKYCNVAIYVPFDQTITQKFEKDEEWNVLTYRTKWHKVKPKKNFFIRLYRKLLWEIGYRRIVRHFDKIYQEYKPDILHVHVAGGVGLITSIISERYNIPMIVTEHQPVELMNCELGTKNYNLHHDIYMRSKFNACVSEDLRSKMEQIFCDCQFHTVYNGITDAEIDKNSIGSYRKQGYINVAIVALLYNKEIKGMQFLLPAIKKVIECGYKIVLHHIGGGIYLEYYKEMARNLGIEEYCVFYGQCNKNHIYQIVNDVDFFVSSSLLESAGVSVMEAMILGKPILATKSGGVNSLVPDFGGIVVEKGSEKALVEGLLTMIGKYEDFDRQQIRQYARDNFLIDNISRSYIKIYRDVIENNPLM